MRAYEATGAEQRNIDTDLRVRATRALETSNELLSKLDRIRQAATRWPRCCDRWQDGIGGMHCTDCAQKTFAMMAAIQSILGIGKDGKPLDAHTSAEREELK